MPDQLDIYREVIVDHNKNPRNFRKQEAATHTAQGINPHCGDSVTVYLRIEEGVIQDISFQGSGCAISKSSASIMTTVVKGRSPEQAEKIFEDFRHVLIGDVEADQDPEGPLGRLTVFGGIRKFPTRVKCASLAWHALHAALNRSAEPITTEDGF